jgi:hypothetical protein
MTDDDRAFLRELFIVLAAVCVIAGIVLVGLNTLTA